MFECARTSASCSSCLINRTPSSSGTSSGALSRAIRSCSCARADGHGREWISALSSSTISTREHRAPDRRDRRVGHTTPPAPVARARRGRLAGDARARHRRADRAPATLSTLRKSRATDEGSPASIGRRRRRGQPAASGGAPSSSPAGVGTAGAGAATSSRRQGQYDRRRESVAPRVGRPRRGGRSGQAPGGGAGVHEPSLAQRRAAQGEGDRLRLGCFERPSVFVIRRGCNDAAPRALGLSRRRGRARVDARCARLLSGAARTPVRRGADTQPPRSCAAARHVPRPRGRRGPLRHPSPTPPRACKARSIRRPLSDAAVARASALETEQAHHAPETRRRTNLAREARGAGCARRRGGVRAHRAAAVVCRRPSRRPPTARRGAIAAAGIGAPRARPLASATGGGGEAALPHATTSAAPRRRRGPGLSEQTLWRGLASAERLWRLKTAEAARARRPRTAPVPRLQAVLPADAPRDIIASYPMQRKEGRGGGGARAGAPAALRRPRPRGGSDTVQQARGGARRARTACSSRTTSSSCWRCRPRRKRWRGGDGAEAAHDAAGRGAPSRRPRRTIRAARPGPPVRRPAPRGSTGAATGGSSSSSSSAGAPRPRPQLKPASPDSPARHPRAGARRQPRVRDVGPAAARRPAHYHGPWRPRPRPRRRPPPARPQSRGPGRRTGFLPNGHGHAAPFGAAGRTRSGTARVTRTVFYAFAPAYGPARQRAAARIYHAMCMT